MAKCPAHPDRQASLHVSCNDRGLGLKCHAGCSTDEILQLLDLPWDALFSDELPEQRAQPVEYDYRDHDGRLLYQVLRYEGKQFRQRVPNGDTWTWSLNGVKRVPYMLPNIIESSDEDTIFVVEGEKDVHTLNAKGILATTNSGGAKWDWPEDWKVYFEGRRVVLIPDTDEPGMAHMNQIGALLSPVADVFTLRLRGAKDITDWFLAHPDPELKEFNELVENAVPWGQKVSLAFAEPPPEFAYTDAPVWDGLLGQITKAVDPYSEHDPVAFFMELMTMFGCSLNRNPHYLLGKTPHYTNLFVCIVGDTAEGRKGTAHGYAKDIFKRIDPDFVQKRMPASLASGEGLVNMVRDGKTKTKGEEVIVLDEGVTDKRLLVIDEEFAARTLIAMNREGSSLAGVLRSSWDGPDTLDVPTKMNSIMATKPHIGMIGHATPIELMATLRPEHVAGGSANRFLWFMVHRSKQIDSVDVDPPEQVLLPLVNKLMRAKDFAVKRGRMYVSEDAHKTFQDIRREYESAHTDDTGQQRHFIGRGMPQIMRMAMILALVEMEEVIQTPHLEQAYGLFNFSRTSVDYILDTEQLVLNSDEQKLFYMLEIEGALSQSDIKDKLGWNGPKAARVSASLISKKLAHEYREPAKGGRGGKPRRVLAV